MTPFSCVILGKSVSNRVMLVTYEMEIAMPLTVVMKIPNDAETGLKVGVG